MASSADHPGVLFFCLCEESEQPFWQVQPTGEITGRT